MTAKDVPQKMENDKEIFNDSLTGQTEGLLRRYYSIEHLNNLAKAALEEDIGSGDVSAEIFEENEPGKAEFLAKQSGVLSGRDIVNAVFANVDPTVSINWLKADGEEFQKGEILAEISGPIRSLLQAERTALNFIQHTSGIATLTKQYVDALTENSRMKIFDTRKTLPLLRAIEKKAVRDGGGSSHRYALYDMAMLKNNHIDAAGGIQSAVKRLEAKGFFDRSPRLGLCIETRNLAEALEAVENRSDIIMLDNIPPADVSEIVEKIRQRVGELNREMPLIELSGGITLEKLPDLSRLPVDRVSIGAITHSVKALDIAMHYRL